MGFIQLESQVGQVRVRAVSGVVKQKMCQQQKGSQNRKPSPRGCKQTGECPQKAGNDRKKSRQTG